jgi:hypothetical protein
MSAIENNPSWHDFDVAVARWSLGDLPAEQLPRAAMEALVAGCETDSLPVLASLETAG